MPSALLNVKVTIPALAPPAVLSSHVTMCARYAPEMSERGRGAILKCRLARRFQPLPRQATYGHSKRREPRLHGALVQSGRQDLNLRPPGPQPDDNPATSVPCVPIVLTVPAAGRQRTVRTHRSVPRRYHEGHSGIGIPPSGPSRAAARAQGGCSSSSKSCARRARHHARAFRRTTARHASSKPHTMKGNGSSTSSSAGPSGAVPKTGWSHGT